jgi:hypothetical protein
MFHIRKEISMDQDDDIIFVAISTGVATLRSGERIEFVKDKTFLRGSHPLRRENPTYFVVVGGFLEWAKP